MSEPLLDSNELIFSNAVLCAATLSLLIDAKLVTVDQAKGRLRDLADSLPERLKTPGLLKQLQLVSSGLDSYSRTAAS